MPLWGNLKFRSAEKAMSIILSGSLNKLNFSLKSPFNDDVNYNDDDDDDDDESQYKLLFLGHRSLIKNKTQTAVINIVNKRILINLTFSMLDNIHFQK